MRTDSSPLLSVVIPSYNTGNYISEAVLSITKDIPSAEIIVIDDNSTDNTIKNLNLLNLENLVITPLNKTSPGGAGYPSNIGIEKSSGRYIAFVDSDDFFLSGYLSNMLKNIQAYDADICVSSYRLTDAITHKTSSAYDHLTWKKLIRGRPFGKLSKDQYLTLSPEPWRKMYHSRLFEDIRIRFPVNGWFNEDYPFHWFCGLASRKDILFCNNEDYFHRISRTGQTTDVLDERIFFVFDHTKEILDHMHQNPNFDAYKGNLLYWLLTGAWKLNHLNVRIDEYYEKLRRLILTFDSNALKKLKKIGLWEQLRVYKSIIKSQDANEFKKEMGWHRYEI